MSDATPLRLHVNVDHVATLREARRIDQPDPVAWALAAEQAGAHGITCHLRKDRRHIQDADLVALRRKVTSLLNLESSLDAEMTAIALASGADEICIVPENRQEVTTEGGLDVIGETNRLGEILPRFHECGMLVSLFVDPDPGQIEACAGAGADFVELHTGRYANSDDRERERELVRLQEGAVMAHNLGLRVNAGHGLNRDNVSPIAALPFLEDLNIGHSIVAEALFVGVQAAVQSMLAAMDPTTRVEGAR